MRIACWPIPELDPLAASLEALGYEVFRATPHACRIALAQGDADVALVTSLDVLLEPDRVQVIPGAGVATLAAYPYAALHLQHGLDRLQEIGFDPRSRQEVLLARLLLREHYLSSPQFVPLGLSDTTDGGGNLDGILASDPDAELPFEPAITLNLGREWYELTTRPMVWGLFAAGPGRIEPEGAARLREHIRAASPVGDARTDEAETVSVVRTLLDEFALQGLEEWVKYLFYTGTLDEIADFRFTPLPEAYE